MTFDEEGLAEGKHDELIGGHADAVVAVEVVVVGGWVARRYDGARRRHELLATNCSHNTDMCTNMQLENTIK